MWRNYLTVGIRALLKNRVYAVINIVGLAIGLAACLLILTYVRYEFSYDNWLPEAQNTYEMATEYLPSPGGQQPGTSLTTAYIAGGALKKDFPQVDRVVWASSQNVTFLQDGAPTAAKKALITDGPLFDIVRVPFVRGDGATALNDPHSIALSESEAEARFGNKDPLGKTVTIAAGDMTADYRVTGVFKDLPRNSHF
ncbi:MAG TPA: ABC transporter permease, partial [Sphingomonas sp.]